jgi:hypothetical protein
MDEWWCEWEGWWWWCSHPHKHCSVLCSESKWLLFGQSLLVFVCAAEELVSERKEDFAKEARTCLVLFLEPVGGALWFFLFFFIPDLGVFERLVSNLRLTFASHLGLDIGSAVFSCSIKICVVLESSELSNYKIYWLLLLRASWDWICWFCTQDLGGVGGRVLN